MNVALINAPVKVRSPHAHLAPPLGLAYVAASLIEAGHCVTAIDFNISGLNLRRVDGFVEHDKPAVIGISAMTETYPNALAIARRVKDVDPSIVVVMGGAHPSILPEDVVMEDPVDYVIVGDGEKAMVELVSFLGGGGGRLEEIAGLGYGRDGVAHINERAPLPNPDDLPYPARDIFPLDMYPSAINVLTATGSCPYKCPFCSAAAIWQGRRMMRSPESIVGELRMLMDDFGIDHVVFIDDIFTLNKRWVYRLLDALDGLDRRVGWGCSTRVDLVDAELLQAMAEHGCCGIQFGVESGNQAILDSVKGIEKTQVIDAVTASVDAGIDTICSFMVPFPEDTRETLRETADFIGEVHRAGSEILCSYTAPYPGTYFFENAEELGLKILTDSWDEFDAKHLVMETRHLKAAEIEEALEQIMRQNDLHRRTE